MYRAGLDTRYPPCSRNSSWDPLLGSGDMLIKLWIEKWTDIFPSLAIATLEAAFSQIFCVHFFQLPCTEVALCVRMVALSSC